MKMTLSRQSDSRVSNVHRCNTYKTEALSPDIEAGGANGAGQVKESSRSTTSPSFTSHKDLNAEADTDKEYDYGKEGQCEQDVSALASSPWSPQGRQKTTLLLMFLILVLGAAASAAFLAIGIGGALTEAHRSFQVHGKDLKHAIESAWDDYEMFALWIHESCHVVDEEPFLSLSAQNVAEHAGFCSREKFQHLYEHISSVELEFVAMSYMPNITHSEREYLEEEARQYYLQREPDMPYVGIKALELSPDDGSVVSLGSSPEKSWYIPMHYLLPLKKNEGAVEIDLFSYRPREIEKALETQKPVMGSRARLFSDPDPRVYGVEFIHPGLQTDLDKKTERRNGFSKVVIKIPSLLHRTARLFYPDSRVFLFDESDTENDPEFLAAADFLDGNVILLDEVRYDQVPSSSLSFSDTFSIMDKKWRIVVHPVNGMYQANLAYVILGGSVIMLACLIIALWLNSHLNRLNRENRIKSQAQEEKSKLALSQVRRERHLNDFIAHEVRNPLTSAIAALSFASSTARERVGEPSVCRSLLDDIEIVDASLEYINDLLKNMLDIHKSASNEMKLSIAPTNILNELFEPVAKILVPRCGSIETILECPPSLTADVDHLRMKQVILNLAINAAKFVESGFIRLRAEVVNGNTCIFVEDSGPGIPAQKRGRLFEKFQESLDMRNQGTGIGLHVCQNLTKLMGGTIYLDEHYHSEIEGSPGARFVINLQQSPKYQQEVSTPTSPDVLPSQKDLVVKKLKDNKIIEDNLVANAVESSLEGITGLPNELHVLFVDDDPVLRKLFTRCVARVRPGWKIDQATYGEEALGLVEENTYDVIFIDQYMASDEKKLLGTEAVTKLRSDKHVTSIICGLSANDMKSQFVDAGADHFMLKPFPCEKKALEGELLRVLGLV